MKQIRVLLKKIRKFSRFQKLILLAFLVALSFTAVRVVRTVSDMAYWHYHQDEPLNAWMNLHYVAHSYHIPPHVLYQALNLPHKPPDKRSLKTLSKSLDMPFETLKAKLEQAIIHARPPYPPPPPPSPHEAPL
jgi:hypothetical protein